MNVERSIVAGDPSRLMQAAWASVFAAFFAWSAIGPKDYPTWFVEVLPAVVGAGILWFTRKRYPLTSLAYVLILIHCVVLIVGGHYTYARTPMGNWLRYLLDLDRNPYDRIGHFLQGFVPAILVRELLVRRSPLRGSRWLGPMVVCACLAFSAFFEMLEWWAAVVGGEAADDFLATQGDVWDTQWDMFLALTGAILSLLLLSRWHDRQLATLLGGRAS